MKRWILVSLICVGLAGPAFPQEGMEERVGDLEAENADLRNDLEALRRELSELSGRRGVGGQLDGPAPSGTGTTILDINKRETERLGTKGGLFSKPFLADLANRTYVGGYIDLEYRDEQGERRTFRQHRFIPFIYSQVTDQIRVAAEIEFEDGGTDAPRGDGETKVEFATLDYQPWEAFGIRAGAILIPLGKFNLIHDSPVNDLTDRPLVSQFVIPSTLNDAGVGIFGTFYPTEESVLNYELYATNGFVGLEADATSATGFTSNFNTTSGVRGGRPSLKEDNNNSISGVGRISVSPRLGTEVGVSAFTGAYDDKGDNNLLIYALDVVHSITAALEFQGEIARAEIERDTLARTSGVPKDLWGFYSQLNYHFMPEYLEERWPIVFGEDSIFTAVARLGHVELGSVRTQRVTAGLNFRPIEGTVFKIDYQFNFEDWSRGRVDNDAFLFSIASYF